MTALLKRSGVQQGNKNYFGYSDTGLFQYLDILGANLKLDPKISLEIEEELRFEMIWR